MMIKGRTSTTERSLLVLCGCSLGNGDVNGWRGKRNRPRWKTSTEWQRRETVANHAAGIAPSAPTRSLGISQCGSSEKRENKRIHRGPRDRNGSLGAKLVNGRVCPEAAPLSVVAKRSRACPPRVSRLARSCGTGRRGAVPLMTDHEHLSGTFGIDAPGLGYG